MNWGLEGEGEGADERDATGGSLGVAGGGGEGCDG
jgi:hypothetical protein